MRVGNTFLEVIGIFFMMLREILVFSFIVILCFNVVRVFARVILLSIYNFVFIIYLSINIFLLNKRRCCKELLVGSFKLRV